MLIISLLKPPLRRVPKRLFSSSTLQLRPSIGHDFFLRNNLTDLLNDNNNSNNNSKFIISCQPVHSSDDSSSHIPFKVVPKPIHVPIKVFHDNQIDRVALRKKLNGFLALTKPNLTILVMLSSICSYALAPYPTNIPSLICLTIGTTLCSGSANSINMAREPNFDKKMKRTSNRPVVTGLIKPAEAYSFATLTGGLGYTILYFGVNPLVANLGLLNIVLYSWIYTSLKRKSIINTWVGALVGAIPPLMGWASCCGHLNDPGAWCLALLLYAWQFPHFNSLSHNIKFQYKNAGYVMTAFENPKLNARVAFRYALLMFVICYGLSYNEICDYYFLIDSSLLNGWLTYWSFKFWYQQRLNDKLVGEALKEGELNVNKFAKKLFWGSVWQLPGILILALLHKKGIWDNFFQKKEKKLI